MKPDLERTLKLKQAAERLMCEGNMERYLHALRLLLAQRTRNAALA
ncbi:MAG: hypothetical protein KJZ58_05370 [Flavobacteriales bacterium]|nr:hypothetical protein [Flavobacteriales bacterium]MCL4281677.1 hypothetical protein [Flavobacteriales bacterium]